MKTTAQVQETPDRVNNNRSKKWKVLSFFSIGTLIVGMLTAYLSFAMFPLNRTYNQPAIYPPMWAFWVVWLILYPTMGIAAGYVWLERKVSDVRGAMVFYASILLTNFIFLPISNLSGGNPAIMTFMDMNGVLTAGLLGWLFARYSKLAFYWLLPLIGWMPVTTAFKILLWLANPAGS